MSFSQDDLEAYKTQNQFLNSEVHQVSKIWSTVAQREKNLLMKVRSKAIWPTLVLWFSSYIFNLIFKYIGSCLLVCQTQGTLGTLFICSFVMSLACGCSHDAVWGGPHDWLHPKYVFLGQLWIQFSHMNSDIWKKILSINASMCRLVQCDCNISGFPRWG